MKAILAPNGKPARQEIRNWYDAGRPASFSKDRAIVARMPEIVRREQNPWVRYEMLKQSRDLVHNSPFINGLIERMVVYVCGSGIWPFAATADPEYNKKRNASWRRFARQPDIRSDFDWPALLAQIYRTELVEGDCGIVLTSYRGEPKLCIYEGKQLKSYTYTQNWGPTDEFDGIKIDKLGRPLSYRIEADDGSMDYTYVDAANFVHVYNPLRPGQLRGMPLLASAIFTARDIQEIINFEKLAVKWASSMKDVIKTATGEVTDESVYSNGYVAQDTETKERYYKDVAGPHTLVLKTGDEWQETASNRPSPAWAGFMDFLAQTVCLSAGIPPSVLLQMKVGGADTRRDLATAKRKFDIEQRRIACKAQKIWEYQGQAAIANGEIPPPPDGVDSCTWRFPAAITVDAGRDRAADLKDVEAGLITLEEYHAEGGMDAVEIEAQNVMEMARRRDLLAAQGITLEEYAMLRRLEVPKPQTQPLATQ
jgi:capsid protein